VPGFDYADDVQLTIGDQIGNASELVVDRAGVEHSDGQRVEVAMSTDSSTNTSRRLTDCCSEHPLRVYCVERQLILADQVRVEQTESYNVPGITPLNGLDRRCTSVTVAMKQLANVYI